MIFQFGSQWKHLVDHSEMGKLRAKLATKRSFFSTLSPPPWRVLFFGTGQVALETCKLLHGRSDLVSDLRIVCAKPSHAKFKFPVLEWARKKQVCVHLYNPHPKHMEGQEPDPTLVNAYHQCQDELVQISTNDAHIGIVVDFGYMLPQRLLSAFHFPPLLMHPSLLPKYRGAAPIEAALMHGEEETGVSVLGVTPNQFDAGEIVLQHHYKIPMDASADQVRHDLAILGAQAMVQCIEQYTTLWPQRKGQGSIGARPHTCAKAPKINPSDYIVDWTQKSTDIYNRWRALGVLHTQLHGCISVRPSKNDNSDIRFPNASTTSPSAVNILIHRFIKLPLDDLSILPAREKAIFLLSRVDDRVQLMYDKYNQVLWCKTSRPRPPAHSADDIELAHQTQPTPKLGDKLFNSNDPLGARSSVLGPGETISTAQPSNWIGISLIQFESGPRVIDASSFVNGIQLRLHPYQFFF